MDVSLPTYPYGKSRYKPYITWVFMGDFIPKHPKVEHNKHHGSTRTLGAPTRPCPLILAYYLGVGHCSSCRSPSTPYVVH